MGSTTAGAVAIKHRIIGTSEMAEALGYVDTDWVAELCRNKTIPRAFRVGGKGNWRIFSRDFRDYLIENGLPTAVLDESLETPKPE